MTPEGATARVRAPYQRGRVTWSAFGALFAFGLLNAVLGPALPYLRDAEHISYLVGALHQAAFAVGGGLAGLFAARERSPLSRRATIAAGIAGAGAAGLLIGYGNTPAVTICGALLVSLLATSALISVWAALADLHAEQRAVAMTEGEVSVSFAGILTPAIIAGLAATALGWRFAFAISAVVAVAAAAITMRVGVPQPAAVRERDPETPSAPRQRRSLPPTLLIVFAVVALEFGLSFWLASYLNDDVGFDRTDAVVAVSGLYLANFVGRLLASRIARRVTPQQLLAAALALVLIGLPILLAATNAALAGVGIALAGAGIGATFPLASSLHIERSARGADSALGEALTIAALGQFAGPLAAGAIAEGSDLRAGLIALPVLALLAAAALAAYNRPVKRIDTT
ncbi:MAG TPA: MFS transporter [Jatrophihabitans sp.]|nr:MFS transporter [Jatrophihabitans sp.]